MIGLLFALFVAWSMPPPAAAWKAGEGCAYFPVTIGDYSIEGSTVTDIREVLDSRGRTIGVVYVGDDGRYALEGNPLMTDADTKRYHLSRIGVPPYWTGVDRVDPGAIRHRIVECAPSHMMRFPISSVRVKADAGFVYSKGVSHYPDPHIDLYTDSRR